MNLNSCSCEFKERMIAEMMDMRRKSPNKDNEWVDLLFPASCDHSLCCLFTFFLYYGYCKECSIPLSEGARNALFPLLPMHDAIH